MDSAAAPSGLWGMHGFVNTVQLNTTDTDIWNKSTGISFVLFMVIGFCATLGAIGIALVVYLICRQVPSTPWLLPITWENGLKLM